MCSNVTSGTRSWYSSLLPWQITSKNFPRTQVLLPFYNETEMRDSWNMILDVVIRPFDPFSEALTRWWSSSFSRLHNTNLSWSTELPSSVGRSPQTWSCLALRTDCSSYSDRESRSCQILRNHPWILITSSTLKSTSFSYHAPLFFLGPYFPGLNGHLSRKAIQVTVTKSEPSHWLRCMDTTPVVTFGPLLIPQKVRRTCMSLLCVAGSQNLASRVTYHRELTLEFLRDSGHKYEQYMTRFPTCPRTCFAHPTLSHLLPHFSSKRASTATQTFFVVSSSEHHSSSLSSEKSFEHPDHFLLWHLVTSQTAPNLFFVLLKTRVIWVGFDLLHSMEVFVRLVHILW